MSELLLNFCPLVFHPIKCHTSSCTISPLFTFCSPVLSSRYVKYLYPYECEVENLSDPQELQLAIDSHKRDRRQSETVEFMHQPITACRSNLENLTPVTNTITATQGLQILNSPTVALPHGSIPPYSGGFLVTGPGGAQMVTPQISSPPQLVQMTTTPHGIPIMVPAIAAPKPDSGRNSAEDRDDVSSQASSDTSDREPPAKRIALDSGRTVTTAAGKIATMAPSGYVMTPARHVVPTSHFSAHGPHIVQVGQNPHIPVVMPTTLATSYHNSKTSPVETQGAQGALGKADILRRSPLENGITSSHALLTGGAKRAQVVPASHFLQMAPPTHMPLIMPNSLPGHESTENHHLSNLSEQTDSIEHQSEAKEHRGDKKRSSDDNPVMKMPFANISIQSGKIPCMLMLITSKYVDMNGSVDGQCR